MVIAIILVGVVLLFVIGSTISLKDQTKHEEFKSSHSEDYKKYQSAYDEDKGKTDLVQEIIKRLEEYYLPSEAPIYSHFPATGIATHDFYVLTNKRVIKYTQKTTGNELKSILYSKLENVNVKTGLMYSEIKVESKEETIIIELIRNQENFKAMQQYLMQQMAG